jgi:hypothetical protein
MRQKVGPGDLGSNTHSTHLAPNIGTGILSYDIQFVYMYLLLQIVCQTTSRSSPQFVGDT